MSIDSICIYIYICAFVCVCIYLCVCMHMCIYIYIRPELQSWWWWRRWWSFIMIPVRTLPPAPCSRVTNESHSNTCSGWLPTQPVWQPVWQRSIQTNYERMSSQASLLNQEKPLTCGNYEEQHKSSSTTNRYQKSHSEDQHERTTSASLSSASSPWFPSVWGRGARFTTTKLRRLCESAPSNVNSYEAPSLWLFAQMTGQAWPGRGEGSICV